MLLAHKAHWEDPCDESGLLQESRQTVGFQPDQRRSGRDEYISTYDWASDRPAYRGETGESQGRDAPTPLGSWFPPCIACSHAPGLILPIPLRPRGLWHEPGSS